MTTALAQSAYDYLEVVFNAGPNGVARASWEIGQPAGINEVYRTEAGVDYSYLDNHHAGDTAALLFVGFKSDKTLLGVGKLIAVDGIGSSSSPNGLITSNTTSVTFEVEAIKTVLIAGDDHFDYVDSVDDDKGLPSFAFTKNRNNTYIIPTTDDSTYITLGSSDYPIYIISGIGDNINKFYARYKFFGAAHKSFYEGIRVFGRDEIKVKKQLPRFIYNGQQHNLSWCDTVTEVELDTDPVLAPSPWYVAFPDWGISDINSIPITFTTNSGSGGVFSFYIEMPVFALTQAPSTNNGTNCQRWYIRTGLGADLKRLDNGKSSGGCVLIGVTDETDWSAIDWSAYD
jgi:hypothetical protein